MLSTMLRILPITGNQLLHQAESRGHGLKGFTHDDIGFSTVLTGRSPDKWHDVPAFLQEPFGAGDALQCRVSRSASGLTVSYQKNGMELGKAFEMQASPLGAQGSVCKTCEGWDHPMRNHHVHDVQRCFLFESPYMMTWLVGAEQSKCVEVTGSRLVTSASKSARYWYGDMAIVHRENEVLIP